MYRVLITDDEQRDRNIIKILLERQYPGKFTFLEAENGRQAIDLLACEEIDLMFLDINMPGLSGLEVLHHLREMPYVIILTAYDNFTYTREALRCGVRDYLLKPPLRNELYQAVDHFWEDCERMQESLMTQRQSQEVFTRDLAKQLMYYGDVKKIRGLLDVLNITGGYGQCAVLEIDDSGLREAMLDEVEEALNRWSIPYAAALCSESVAVFLFSDVPAAQTEARTLARLVSYLENNFCTSIRVRVGESAMILGGYPGAFMNLCQTEREDPKVGIQNVPGADRLVDAVQNHDFAAAMQAVEPALEIFGSADGNEDLLKYSLLLTLNQCTRRFLREKEAEIAYQKLSGLISVHEKERATELVAGYLEWLLNVTRSQKSLRNNAVQAVLDQIHQDCSQPWSIDALADSLHVNASYLSRLFKEQTGSSFTNYLAELRIERAVELMRTTNLRLVQIGEQVGYEDPNYFSRVFKKRKGIGPREFSKSIRSVEK